jgi:hypothetical protein
MPQTRTHENSPLERFIFQQLNRSAYGVRLFSSRLGLMLCVRVKILNEIVIDQDKNLAKAYMLLSRARRFVWFADAVAAHVRAERRLNFQM